MLSDEDEEDLVDEEDTIENDEDIPIEPEENLREE
jgi:hypothetical protein